MLVHNCTDCPTHCSVSTIETYKTSQHEILKYRLRYSVSHNHEICCYTVYRLLPSPSLHSPSLVVWKQSTICTSSHMNDVRIEKMVEGSYCMGAVIVRTVNKAKVYQATYQVAVLGRN